MMKKMSTTMKKRMKLVARSKFLSSFRGDSYKKVRFRSIGNQFLNLWRKSFQRFLLDQLLNRSIHQVLVFQGCCLVSTWRSQKMTKRRRKRRQQRNKLRKMKNHQNQSNGQIHQDESKEPCSICKKLRKKWPKAFSHKTSWVSSAIQTLHLASSEKFTSHQVVQLIQPL